MVKWLSTQDTNFDRAFSQCLVQGTDVSVEVIDAVKTIIDSVRREGDAALVELTNKFDQLTVTTAQGLKVTTDQIEEAYASCDEEIKQSLQEAAKRIKAYHQKQLPQDFSFTDETGVTLGNRWSAVDSVGLYVPGGSASYPSSVLMNAIPAKVAGVKHMVMVAPTPGGKNNQVVLAAAKIAEIDEIYTIGGAQAIAALALGTQSIPKVDTIVGPGNIYVAEAKRQLFGQVGIDMIAGPTDICVVADSSNNPEWIAADLLSQAEHDTLSAARLVTDDAAFAKQVEEAIVKLLPTLSRQMIAQESWENNGLIVVVEDLIRQAPDIVNAIAPEHLEIATEEPSQLLDNIRHAGAIFLGRFTPEAMGDYIAGPSHVLPTLGTAKFSSGLSVYDFLKRSSTIECSQAAFQTLTNQTVSLANAEGFDAHALSVTIRNH